MSAFFSRARFCAWLALTGLAVTLYSAAALAHGDEDHGTAKPPTITAAGAPRLALRSELYDFVLEADGAKVRIFLDRAADNAPSSNASVTLSVDGADSPATMQPEGSYLADVPSLARPGRHEIIASIAGPDGDDLLIGALDVAQPAAMSETVEGGSSQALLQQPWLLPAAALFTGLLLGLLLRRGRTGVLPLLFIALASLPTPLQAHGDEDHGAAAPIVSTGDAPRRLEDGTLFVSKATQRLLVIRTTAAKSSKTSQTLSLVGRVIANPNFSGLVQSTKGGRVLAPEGGLPALGQSVKRGDVLLEIDAPIPTGDYADLAERAGEVEQQISLAESKITRLAKLVPNAAPQATLDDARTELTALQRRRATIIETRVQREVLRAPVDGIITAANVTLGQVVGTDTILFQVLDPGRLWVEALAFDRAVAEPIKAATAVTQSGMSLPLSFIGRGGVLQSQATRLHFSVALAGAKLSVDTPVTVLVELAQQSRGIIVPRTAVMKLGAGQDVIFEHIAPESFAPRPVRIAPLDGNRVVISAGVAEGARIVVHGGELLAQIR